MHHIVAGCCFRIGKGDNPLPARINSGIDYMKRCECITILGGVAGRGKGATGGSAVIGRIRIWRGRLHITGDGRRAGRVCWPFASQRQPFFSST
jgi:hypothetical protein